MPNWCYSTLTIEGPRDDIDSIMKTDLDFEKILPTPADLSSETYDGVEMTEFQVQSNLATHGCEDEYSWCIANWGTKWNPTVQNNHKSIHRTNPKRIDVTLTTAWSLPLGILKKLSQNNPNTTIQIVDCEEEAGFFVGDCTIRNGVIIQDNIHKPSRKEMLERGMICEDKDRCLK